MNDEDVAAAGRAAAGGDRSAPRSSASSSPAASSSCRSSQPPTWPVADEDLRHRAPAAARDHLGAPLGLAPRCRSRRASTPLRSSSARARAQYGHQPVAYMRDRRRRHRAPQSLTTGRFSCRQAASPPRRLKALREAEPAEVPRRGTGGDAAFAVGDHRLLLEALERLGAVGDRGARHVPGAADVAGVEGLARADVDQRRAPELTSRTASAGDSEPKAAVRALNSCTITSTAISAAAATSQ